MFRAVMSCEEMETFLEREFPQVRRADGTIQAIHVEDGMVRLQMQTGPSHVRPGGTVSGPTLFTLADVAAYVCVLAHLGPVAAVVTTNMSINFLRRPLPGLLSAEARLLKLGARLAVAEVSVFGRSDEPDAHAVGTYAIPPSGSAGYLYTGLTVS